MHKKGLFSFLPAVITIALLVLLVMPTPVFAEGEEPPTEPIATDPAPTEEQPTEAPVEELLTEEVLPTDEVTVEEIATLVEIVETLDENGAILQDAEGNVIPLASVDALETIVNSDPWYTYNGITYRFFKTPAPGDPDPCALFGPAVCFVSDTPIQAALDDAKTRVAATGIDDRVAVCVEAGEFDEDVIISTPVWLQGLPGATLNGIFDIQSSWVTIDGFIINGYIQSRVSPTSDADAYGYQNIQISNNTINPDTTETTHSDTPAGEQEGGGVGIYIGTRSETFNQAGTTQSYYLANRGSLGAHPLDYDPVAPPNLYLAGKGLLDYSGLLISGNTITGGRNAILLQGITGNSDAPIKVEGNTITNVNDRALIWIDSSQWIDINHNILSNSPTGYGLYFSSLADGYYTAASSNTAYTPKTISITCNNITNNFRGIYIGDAFEDTDLNNDSLTILNNNISGNTVGMEVSYRYNGYIDARGNYWGGSAPTPAGTANRIRFYVPGTSYPAGGIYVQNTANTLYVGGGSGRVYYGTFLTTNPCTDGTCTEFVPLITDPVCSDVDQDRICGLVDNCIDTFNPDQLDSDSDGIGDACDPQPYGPPAVEELGGFGGPLDLIPITGVVQQIKEVAQANPLPFYGLLVLGLAVFLIGLSHKFSKEQ